MSFRYYRCCYHRCRRIAIDVRLIRFWRLIADAPAPCRYARGADTIIVPSGAPWYNPARREHGRPRDLTTVSVEFIVLVKPCIGRAHYGGTRRPPVFKTDSVYRRPRRCYVISLYRSGRVCLMCPINQTDRLSGLRSACVCERERETTVATGQLVNPVYLILPTTALGAGIYYVHLKKRTNDYSVQGRSE